VEARDRAPAERSRMRGHRRLAELAEDLQGIPVDRSRLLPGEIEPWEACADDVL
jgi:hypothetical protein